MQGLKKIEGAMLTDDNDDIGMFSPVCTKYRLSGIVVHSGRASGGHN